MKTVLYENLTARQERFILALLTSDSQNEAAAAAGVGQVTACRWMKQPAMQARLKQVKRQAFNKALERLQAMALEAVNFLQSTMRDAEAPYSIRVKAATAILEHATGAYTITQFAERIEQLETALQEQQSQYQRSA